MIPANVRGLLVGRFQPFHLGHLAVMHELRSNHPEHTVVLGIGSAQESYTWRNPFTAGERFELIDRALREAKTTRWVAFPIVDIERHSVWVSHVESLLPPFDVVYTNNPLTRLLFERAGYLVESPTLVDRDRFEGEHVRRALAEGRDWSALVPPAVQQYLREIRAADRLKLLADRRDNPPGR